MARLLVVEDEEEVATPLAASLEAQGYDVETVGTGEEALQALSAGSHDLVVLDLGLPDIDGLTVCRRLRSSGKRVPVIVLTARAEELDTVLGLDAGADDYVGKPFRLAELHARIRAVLRRGTTPEEAVNGVRIDAAARRAWVDDRELDLSPKEFDLLAALLRNAGTVVTREALIDEVWDKHWYGSTKTLDVHISWLRRKLGDDPANPRFLSTVRGIGFRFETSTPGV